MAIIKCKMCGGELEIIEGSSTARCEYCDSLQTIPKVDDEKKLVQFERAEKLRRKCEFDKAAGIYETIVADFRQEAEAYWGLVLCKYGIEYVDDPGTGKKIPTCHRSSFDSILDDSDLELALENADAEARKVYREEAKAIEEIRKGIIAVSSNEKPYDIFICYKETAEDGDRTLDSVLAQDVYDILTSKGYRVFFSRVTLEDKLGMEYEPYIFAALNSAKVMLVFGTDYEYFNAVWVKNEWSRFLKLIANDKEKHLIPCYKDIDPEDMPKEFRRLQAQDLGKVGATQDLLRGIEKIIPRQNEASGAVQERVVFSEGINKIASLLDRGNMALEDGDWAKADSFFEDVLNNDSKNAQAYLGKTLAQEKCRTMDALIRKLKDATQNAKEAPLKLEPDTAHIDEIVKNHTVLNYLEPDQIRSVYHYDLKYSSTVADRKKQYTENENFWKTHKLLSRAEQFATGALAQTLAAEKKSLFDTLSQRIRLAEAEEDKAKQELQNSYQAFLAECDLKIQEKYNDALQTREKNYTDWSHDLETSKDISHIEKIKVGFRRLGDYKDSREMVKKCEEKIKAIKDEQAEKARQQQEALLAAERRKRNRKRIWKLTKVLLILGIIAGIVFFIYYLVTEILPGNQYKKAEALYNEGQYLEAVDAFLECTDYKDTMDRIYGCGEALEKAGLFAQAGIAFGKLDYKDSSTRSFAMWDKGAKRCYADSKSDCIAAVTTAGTVRISQGWLKNTYGTTDITQTAAAEITDAVAIAIVNSNDIAVLRSNGQVTMLCGKNQYYGCTLRTNTAEWTDIVDISSTENGIIGLRKNGTIVCTSTKPLPNTSFLNATKVVDVVAESRKNTDAFAVIRADGTVSVSDIPSTSQEEVAQWTDIVDIDIGDNQVAGLRSDGTVVVSTFDGSTSQMAAQDWTDIVDITCGPGYVVGVNSTGSQFHTASDEYNMEEVLAVEGGHSGTVRLRFGGVVHVDETQWTDIKVPTYASTVPPVTEPNETEPEDSIIIPIN